MEESINQTIKRIRLAKGWGVNDLARAAGVFSSAVSNYERLSGSKSSYGLAKKLLNALGYDLVITEKKVDDE